MAVQIRHGGHGVGTEGKKLRNLNALHLPVKSGGFDQIGLLGCQIDLLDQHLPHFSKYVQESKILERITMSVFFKKGGRFFQNEQFFVKMPSNAGFKDLENPFNPFLRRRLFPIESDDGANAGFG